MMERYKGYWITGSAVPGPPYTHYWVSLRNDPQRRPPGLRGGSRTISRYKFDHDVPGFAEFHGMELGRMFVDHCFRVPSGI